MPVEERVRGADDKPLVAALPPNGPSTSLGASFLYNGSVFRGHQRSGNSQYDVFVQLQVRDRTLACPPPPFVAQR